MSLSRDKSVEWLGGSDNHSRQKNAGVAIPGHAGFVSIFKLRGANAVLWKRDGRAGGCYVTNGMLGAPYVTALARESGAELGAFSIDWAPVALVAAPGSRLLRDNYPGDAQWAGGVCRLESRPLLLLHLLDDRVSRFLMPTTLRNCRRA
jgi:hypothetical protein